MSGGSYNYLYCKDLGEMVRMREQLSSMFVRLRHMGGADDAAEATECFIIWLNEVEKEFHERMKTLELIFRAVEWLDSGDDGEDTFQENLAEYRKKVQESSSG